MICFCKVAERVFQMAPWYLFGGRMSIPLRISAVPHILDGGNSLQPQLLLPLFVLCPALGTKLRARFSSIETIIYDGIAFLILLFLGKSFDNIPKTLAGGLVFFNNLSLQVAAPVLSRAPFLLVIEIAILD